MSPGRPRGEPAGGQLLRSAYIGFFRIPWLPELALGARGSRRLRFLLARSGLAAAWFESGQRPGRS